LVVARVHKDWTAANLTAEETEWLGSRNYAGATDPPVPASVGADDDR